MENEIVREISKFITSDLELEEWGEKFLKKSTLHEKYHAPYIKLVTNILNQFLVPCLKLESTIRSTQNEEQWVEDVSNFLGELEIPLKFSLGSVKSKVELLEVIVEELRAFRLSRAGKSLEQNDCISDLKLCCTTLRLSPPPKGTGIPVFFDKLYENFRKAAPEFLSSPLITQKLSPQQWDYLENLKNELNKEYALRWTMLSARLDSTILAFSWSNRIDEKKKAQVEETFQSMKKSMATRPHVSLVDLLASTHKSLKFVRLSSRSNKVSFNESFAKVKIGQVPDRGGRPRESEAPPPEVPSWQKNNSQGGRGRGRGGYDSNQNQGQMRGHGHSDYNRGGYRNNGNSGGYNDRQFQGSRGGGYNSSGGGQYQNNRGGYNQYGRGQYNDQSGGGYDNQQGGRGNRRGHQNHPGKKRRVQDNRY